MKLYYFDFPGRAEPARLMLTMAGLPFEDVRFKRDDWVSKYKQMSPTGQCPFLELDDGSVLTQTTAIGTYVAKLTGHLPDDSIALARTYELLGCLDDMFQTMAPTFGIQDVEERAAARKALAAPGGKMYAKMAVVEALLARTSTPFYLGDEPTFADIVWFCNTVPFAIGQFDGLDMSVVEPFPRAKAIAAAVKAHPKLAGRYDK